MVKILLFLPFLILSISTFSQKYIAKNGYIKFHSEAPIENIEAHNGQVNSALDASNGNMVFKVLIKSFEFKKALMQEHFNENYLESDKFPHATFIGKIENFSEIDLKQNGEKKVVLTGILTIHGVSKEISEEGKFIVDGDIIQAKSIFTILLADYNIKIPMTVIDNISEEIEITLKIKLKKL